MSIFYWTKHSSLLIGTPRCSLKSLTRQLKINDTWPHQCLNQISYSNRFMSLTSKRPSYVPRNWEFISHYKKTRGFWWPKSSKIRRNRPIPTNFWRTRSSVSFRRKKGFVGISSDLPTTFWRIPRNVILTNFRRYSDADTRDQSSSEKLYTEGDGSSEDTDQRSPRYIPTDYDSSENTNGLWFVGKYRQIIVRRYFPTNHSPSVISDESKSVGIFRGFSSSEYINFNKN